MKYESRGLKAALMARGTSVTWLAEQTGIKRQAVSYIVNGTRKADQQKAERISLAMNMPSNFCLSRYNESHGARRWVERYWHGSSPGLS